jgi:hypothetical protein
MNILTIFVLQFLLSVLVIGLLAKWELTPRLNKLSRHEALFWLTAPHMLRHIGLVFLVPGVIYQPLPDTFAAPAAYGDLTAGLLALTALIALRSGWRIALPIVWVFNVVGTVDLINALRQAVAVPDLGAAWFIPTFFVPLLLVTHYLIFARLLRQPSPAISTHEMVGSTN